MTPSAEAKIWWVVSKLRAGYLGEIDRLHCAQILEDYLNICPLDREFTDWFCHTHNVSLADHPVTFAKGFQFQAEIHSEDCTNENAR